MIVGLWNSIKAKTEEKVSQEEVEQDTGTMEKTIITEMVRNTPSDRVQAVLETDGSQIPRLAQSENKVGRTTDTETRQTHKYQRQHHHRHQNRYQITPHIFLIMTLELTRCKVKTMGRDMIRPEHRRSTHGPITRPRHTPHEMNHNRIQIPYHNQSDRAVQDQHNKLILKPIRKSSKDRDARDI